MRVSSGVFWFLGWMLVSLLGSLGTTAFSTAAIAAEPMSAAETQLYEAARQEGELTWYVAQFGTSESEAMGQAFTARYPGIKVNVIRTTGQVAYARLMQDIRANVAQCDVFSATDVGHLVSLKADKKLLQFTPENAAKLRKPYLDMDPDGYYYTTSANPTIMVYNTNLVPAGEAPVNWTDLIDPKWKGKVAISHPGFSGSTGSWAVMMKKLYGIAFFEKLEKQDPLIGRSLIDPPTVLTAGERSIGISSLATATRLKLAGNPIEIVYPSDGAKLSLSGSAILANAPHPNAAQLFFNHLLSVEAAQLQVKQGQQPLRPEVSPPAGVKAIDEIAIGPLTEAEVIAGVQDVIVEWRDIFGN
ncbi:MAG: extracellular solute-binding protein [Gammaproteobacteria bacterium]|nr:extracellular solute-binding protein [Gammaproteobacteria bacterium]